MSDQEPPGPRPLRKPPWLRTRPPGDGAYRAVKGTLRGQGLHTVCEEARCPNLGECWGCGTATFLLLGDTCTRNCRFCAVRTGNPHGVVDPEEPRRVAEAARDWKLRYVVLTSVDRDDLPDLGAGHFAAVVRAIREAAPGVAVEVLVPDFGARRALVATVVAAGPGVYAHNVETVERLQAQARDRRASWRTSLDALALAREVGAPLTKSSLMLGLGETDDDVRAALRDLRGVGVEALTLGQYLAPTARHLPVQAYVTPERFEAWGEEARALGFRYVASGPLVRSSYRAGELVLEQAVAGRRAPEAAGEAGDG